MTDRDKRADSVTSSISEYGNLLIGLYCALLPPDRKGVSFFQSCKVLVAQANIDIAQWDSPRQDV